jgi:hypothetical protein
MRDTGFFSRFRNVRILAAAREVHRMEQSHTPGPGEPAATDVGQVQSSRETSIISADLDHHAGGLDAVAGSEFVDDRIRLRD